MKALWKLWYKLTLKDFEDRIEMAQNLFQNVKESTKGSINHFYNMDGEKIRGYSNLTIRTRHTEHPLITKYRY
jgi:hypothetical protein